MKYHKYNTERLNAVAPISISSYLSAEGWEKIDTYGNKGAVFHKQGSPEIIAPSSSRFVDYPNVISQIISLLAQDEDRDELSILRDLIVADVDLIRVRAPEADEDGSLPIETGVELVSQSKEMLLASACATVEARRSYRTGSNSRAMEYLRNVRIGQTEVGSFILTIHSPVPPSLDNEIQKEMWPDIISDPFERQVTRKLISSLSALSDAISKVNSGARIDAFEDRVGDGVSSNLCDATSRLIKDGHGIDISVSWSRTRGAPEKRSQISFQKDDSEILREAAKVLKSKEGISGEKIEGYVTKLARDPNASEGRVTIKGYVEGTLTSIQADFDPTLYSKIAEAHDKRATVSITGDLEREGSRWHLRSPRDFSVHSNDEDE